MPLRPVFRDPLRDVLRDVLGGASLRDQVVASLFGASEQGALYDPSDLSTMFQDAGGTVPVAADSDPVRLILDLSGNDNHLTAPSDAARPLYKTDGTLHWLEGDGVAQWMTGTAIPGSFVDFAVGASPGSATNGDFILGNRTASADRLGVRFQESTSYDARVGHFNGSWTAKSRSGAPVGKSVISASVEKGASVSAFLNRLELTGSFTPASNSTDQFSIMSTNAIGPFHDGNLYALAFRAHSSALDSAAFALMEQWAAEMTGVTLP